MRAQFVHSFRQSKDRLILILATYNESLFNYVKVDR